MKKIISVIFGILIVSSLYAQLQDRIWIFGRPVTGTTNATLYFGNLSSPIKPLPCGQPSNITTSNGFEEWAVVTHPTTGNLVFYTDGMNVFNKFHTLVDIDPAVPGYESLGANPSSSQPVAISLVPGAGADGFYIFSNATGANAISVDIGKITYRLYNAIANTFGSVQNLPGPYGLSDVSEGMKIVPSETDPNTLWLITSLFPVAGMQYKYVVYKIHQSVVTYQGEIDMGPIKLTSGGSGASPIINITYTESNTAVGVTKVGFSNQYTSSIFMCDFDNTNGQFLTGTLKTYLTGWTGYIPSVYDLEFSPNGQFLYYTAYYTTGTTNDLYQINLQNYPLTSVLVHTFDNRYAGGLKLGPDGLIYHIHDNGYFSDTSRLGRILQPDVAYVPGITVFSQFYHENFQKYPHIYATAMSEFLVLPTALTGNSDNLPNKELADIYVYPNPGTDFITITNSSLMKNGIASVYNIHGQLLFQQKIIQDNTELDIRNLDKGIYFLSMICNDIIKVLRFAKE